MARRIGVEVNGKRLDQYWLHTGDDGKDRITVSSTEDVEPILEANKRDYAGAGPKFGRDGFHRVARIPATVIEEVCRINNIPFKEFMDNKTDKAQRLWNVLMNSPEFRSFRTRPGRVDMGKP